MEILNYWDNEYYKKRLDWAKEAHEIFRNKLLHESSLSELKLNPEEARIALFGSSSVGKTTLILKLLGIKDINFERISDILKCGQKSGNASTPTAFIYKLNEDNKYSFGKDNKLTEEIIRKKLKKIRKDVEDQVYTEDKNPIIVGLPIEYFNIPDEKFLYLKIIDLPGYGSSNLKEHPHVNKIITNYTSICDLVLLVEKAESISRFSEINFDSLKYWRDNSVKFRIVTTYSISPRSIRNKIKNMNTIDSKNYLKLFRESFVDTSFKDELPSDLILYPLEYGDSWKKQELTEFFSIEKKNNLDLILKSIFEELRNDIINSTSEYSRLIISKKHQNSIMKIRDREQNKLIEEKNMLINKIDDLEIIKSDKKLEKKNLKNKIELKENDFLKYKSFKFNVGSFIDNNQPNLKKIGKEDVIEYIDNFKASLINKYESFKLKRKSLKSSVLKFFNMNNLVTAELKEIRNSIDEYITGYNWIIFGHDIHKDMKAIHESFKFCIILIENNLNSQLKKEIEEYNNKIEIKIKKLKEEIEDIKDEVSKINLKKNEIQNTISKIVEEEKEQVRRFNHDINICNKFDNILTSNFIKHYNETVNEVSVSIEIDKILNISYLSLITQEFNNILKL